MSKTTVLVIYDKLKPKGFREAMKTVISEDLASQFLGIGRPMIDVKVNGVPKQYKAVERRLFSYKDFENNDINFIIVDGEEIKS